MREPKSILITGASSGIGAALAQEYAAPGVHLWLGGRDLQRLEDIESACRAKGADAELHVADVLDREALADWIGLADDAAPLDLVIANAGVSAGTGHGGESADQARRIFAINVDGVVNTVQPALEIMLRRPNANPRGQIALMSSLAAFRGFGGAPAYCASKAAVKSYAEALRTAHARDGIEVSAICPGFVRTPMTDVNPYPMPLRVDAPRAARTIRRGLAKNRGRIAFPWPLYATAWLLGTLPPGLSDAVIGRLPAKG